MINNKEKVLQSHHPRIHQRLIREKKNFWKNGKCTKNLQKIIISSVNKGFAAQKALTTNIDIPFVLRRKFPRREKF